MPVPHRQPHPQPHRLRIAGRFTARAAILALAAFVPACGGRGGSTANPTPKPPQAVGPMDISGQRVLVMPVQSVAGVPQTRADATREVLFALGERNPRVRWIEPEQLRAALRRAPGYAEDPDVLPSDAFRHHRERYVVEPLGGVLRRYSALMDARLVLIPQSAQWQAAPAGDGSGNVRMAAVLIDTRTGNVVWWGEADGPTRPTADATALPAAAAALATRMLVPASN